MNSLKVKKPKSSFYNNRLRESIDICAKYGGRVEKYNANKRLNEIVKTLRINETLNHKEFMERYTEHMNRFPTWYDVKDATEPYVKIYEDEKLSTTYTKVGPTYAVNGDYMELLKFAEQIQLNPGVNSMIVVTHDNVIDTRFTPNLMVLMKDDKDKIMLEAIKHQPWLCGTTKISCVGIVRLNNNDDNGNNNNDYDECTIANETYNDRALILTKDIIWHRRYLHGDFQDIVYTPKLPLDKYQRMRACYEVCVHNISAIQFENKKGLLITVRNTMEDEDKLLSFPDSQSVITDLKRNGVIITI